MNNSMSSFFFIYGMTLVIIANSYIINKNLIISSINPDVLAMNNIFTMNRKCLNKSICKYSTILSLSSSSVEDDSTVQTININDNFLQKAKVISQIVYKFCRPHTIKVYKYIPFK